jgi:hypothetical protein
MSARTLRLGEMCTVVGLCCAFAIQPARAQSVPCSDLPSAEQQAARETRLCSDPPKTGGGAKSTPKPGRQVRKGSDPRSGATAAEVIAAQARADHAVEERDRALAEAENARAELVRANDRANDLEVRARDAENRAEEARKSAIAMERSVESATKQLRQVQLERDSARAEADNLTNTTAVVTQRNENPSKRIVVLENEVVEGRWYSGGLAVLGLALGSGLGVLFARAGRKPRNADVRLQRSVHATPRIEPSLTSTRVEGATLAGTELHIAGRLEAGGNEWRACHK